VNGENSRGEGTLGDLGPKKRVGGREFLNARKRRRGAREHAWKSKGLYQQTLAYEKKVRGLKKREEARER